MKASAGFTLAESVVVLAVCSVLAFMTIDLLGALRARLQALTAVTLLADSLSQARYTAIARQVPVTVCGSSTALSCDNRWQDGVLMFTDIARSGKPASPDTILGFHRIDRHDARITWRGFGSGSSLRFDRMGRASASNGSFTYCPADKENRYARQVVISRGGRVRFSRDTDKDGVHEDARGRPLNCG